MELVAPMTHPPTAPARSRRSKSSTATRSTPVARPSRSVVDAGRPPMSKRKGLLDFLMALGFFVGLPVAVMLFARLVLNME